MGRIQGNVSKGQPLRIEADTFNALLEGARDRKPKGQESSPKYRFRKPSRPHPFQIIITDDDKVKIVYGEVNGNPPKINSTPLEPNLSDSPELTIDVSQNGLRFVFLKITIGNTTLDLNNIEILDFSSSSQTDTNTEGFFEIGRLQIQDNKIVTVSLQRIKDSVVYAYAGGALHYIFYGGN